MALVGGGMTACPGPVRGTCDTWPCPDNQYCDVVGRVCAAAGGPVITLQSPGNETLDGGLLLIKGEVNPLAEATQVSYRLQGSEEWIPLDVPGQDGRFEDTVLLPTLDGEGLQVEVMAASAAQEYRVEAIPRVDNVRPTLTLSGEDGQHLVPTELRVTFSEPVNVSPGWLALFDPAGALSGGIATGTWSADRRTFSISLPRNQTIRARVLAASVRDDVGHGVAVDLQRTFFTEPALPPVGAITMSERSGEVIRDFSLAADPDGVVTLVIRRTFGGGTTQGDTTWVQLSPDTGLPVVHIGFEGTRQFVQAFAGFALQTDVDPPIKHRITGMHERAGPDASEDTGTTMWREGSTAKSDAPLAGIVATPTACGETGETFAAPLRLAETNTYYGRNYPPTERPLNMRVKYVVVRSHQSWQVFNDYSGNLRVLAFEATCTLPKTASFLGPVNLRQDLSTTNPATSVALPDGRGTLYVYNNASGARVEACFGCVVAPDSSACAPLGERTAEGTGLRVTSAHSGTRVIGARRNAVNAIELVRRDIADCGSAWEVISTVPDSAATLSFEPTMFGTQPGLVYLKGSQLHVFR